MIAGKIVESKTAQQCLNCKYCLLTDDFFTSCVFVVCDVFIFWKVCARKKDRMGDEAALLKEGPKSLHRFRIHCNCEVCTVGRKAQLWGWAAGHP